MSVIVGMTSLTLPLALAQWMSNRLIDTLDGPLDHRRTYALTVIDPADLDLSTMQVRASVVVDDERRPHAIEERPDALASVSRLWLLPDGGWGGPCVRASRPADYARRRPALSVAVVADEGMGVVVRFEDDPDAVTVVEPRRAAGLLLPVVLHWQAYEDELA